MLSDRGVSVAIESESGLAGVGYPTKNKTTILPSGYD